MYRATNVKSEFKNDVKTKKVMVVDKAFLVRKITSKFLIEIGIDIVDDSANVLELFNKIKFMVPDVIIIDSLSYDENKVLMEKIRENYPNTKILMSLNSKGDLFRHYNNGLKHFIYKPTMKENLQKFLAA